MIIIAQVIFTLLVVAIFLFLLGKTSNRHSALKKILVFLLMIVAITFIADPSLADTVAHFFGIGRGADLLFYATTLIVIFSLLNNFLQRKQDKKIQTKLIRRISLLDKKIQDLSNRPKK